jgi:hypothetical protein
LLKNSRASLESGRQPEDKKSSGRALRDTRELSRSYRCGPLLTHRFWAQIAKATYSSPGSALASREPLLAVASEV